jgi:multidrug transporter EmrE-like cation transporter
MQLFHGMLVGILAHVLSFFQLQGQFKIQFLKENTWAVVLMGVPISYLFVYSVKYMVAAYDGEIWPSRLIGFSTGTVIFTVLSYFVFNETISTKTLICLSLAVAILLIQIFWR